MNSNKRQTDSCCINPDGKSECNLSLYDPVTDGVTSNSCATAAEGY